MKPIEDYTPQECLQLIARQGHDQAAMLKSIKANIMVIAIPFWIVLCIALAGLALFLVTVFAV